VLSMQVARKEKSASILKILKIELPEVLQAV
jgi:hypothetical protein